LAKRIARRGRIAMALPQRLDVIESPAETDAEKARREFLQRVGSLDGVLRIELDSDSPIAEPSFRVYVRSDDPEAEYRVYDVECDIRRRYTEARLDVLVLKRPAPSAAEENGFCGR
jgi:hypothetical protein